MTSILTTQSQRKPFSDRSPDTLVHESSTVTPLALETSSTKEEQIVEAVARTTETVMIDPDSKPPSLEANNNDGEIGCEQAPASSLVSPPESSHEDIDNSLIAPETTYTLSPSHSRHTSPPPQEHFQRYTPESGSIRGASQSSCGDGSIEKEQPKLQRQFLASAQIADEESLKLIKELQAQDLGLRRRGKT